MAWFLPLMTQDNIEIWIEFG